MLTSSQSASHATVRRTGPAAAADDDHLVSRHAATALLPPIWATNNASDAAACVARPACAKRDFFASWVAYGAGMVVAYPLDTLRVRWQCLGQRPLHTIRVDGPRSLFAGVSTPLLVMGPVVSGLFAAYESFKPRVAETGWFRDQKKHHLNGHISTGLFSNWTPTAVMPHAGFSAAETFVAGAVAGAVSAQVVTPVVILRVMQQNAASGGRATPAVSEMARTVMARDGVRGFWRANLTLTGLNAGGRGLYFAAYESLKHMWGNNAAAAVGATTLWLLVVFPLDLVSTRVIAAPGRRVNVRTEAARIIRNRGWRAGLYQGFTIALMRSAAWSGIQLPLYDVLRTPTAPIIQLDAADTQQQQQHSTCRLARTADAVRSGATSAL